MKNIVLLFCCVQAFSQVPPWEDEITLGLPANSAVMSAYSDGYGQHLGVTGASGTGLFQHYLIGNKDGSAIFTPITFSSSAGYGAVTGYGGKLYVVVSNSAADQLKVYESSNGGSSFTLLADPPMPGGTTVQFIDAFADGNGKQVYTKINKLVLMK